MSITLSMIKTFYVKETDSTNDYLRRYTPADDEEMTVVWTDFQLKGRGQGSNSWESEAGKKDAPAPKEKDSAPAPQDAGGEN